MKNVSVKSSLEKRAGRLLIRDTLYEDTGIAQISLVRQIHGFSIISYRFLALIAFMSNPPRYENSEKLRHCRKEMF